MKDKKEEMKNEENKERNAMMLESIMSHIDVKYPKKWQNVDDMGIPHR